MIGNDVIDLTAARIESNWRRKGFVDKLFSEEEQALIMSSANPEVTVWLLWSMKEAAYKIHNRKTGIRGFFPLRLRCSIDAQGYVTTGRVSCNERLYFTRTLICGDQIHTVAVTNVRDFDKVTEGIKDDVIKDATGLPCIGSNPASVSHHGRVLKIVYIPSVKAIPATT